jgi:predicted DNA-binding transcriptional regulator AlpA
MATDPPRLISRKEAAAYCGVSPTTFSTWVASGQMPQPVLGTKWDKRAIDARLDELSGISAPQVPPPEEDAFEKWAAKQRERDKHAPIHNLDAREERVVRFMIAHPECTTVDEIPQAGEKTMEAIANRGVVRAGAKITNGKRQWFVTDEGLAEIERTDTWRNWKF